MHDLKSIREQPEAFDAGLKKRGLAPLSGQILTLDKEWRDRLQRVEELQAERNQLSKSIGQKMGALKQAEKSGGDVTAMQQEVEATKTRVGAINDEIEKLQASTETQGELQHLLETLPNLPDDTVPVGADEAANQELTRWGNPPALQTPKQHFELGESLGLMDFERAAQVSGARFVYLTGALARLERALASFMLDMHTQEFGYTEVVPPHLVRDEAVYGTGQLPKFKDDLFQTTDGRWLIPTAEVVLANLGMDRIFTEEELPLRLTAYTPCYRSEAGSAGRDTRGMIRQHQFSKVELVAITAPEKSTEEHERMLHIAEQVLQRLELPYRVMLLSTGDMGFSAEKTYDLEVWLPGQNSYREISSVSNCGAFQSRRMKARMRREAQKQTEPVHMLNGSALAVGRTLVAVLENYQQEDGSILVPEKLQHYCGNLRRIEAAN